MTEKFAFPALLEHVLRNEFIDCREAMILLAYSISKREKNALVYQYTDDQDTMKELKLPMTNFEAAKKYCEENWVSVHRANHRNKIANFIENNVCLQVPRTNPTLKLPLAVASNMQKKIDVFVVVTESVGRFCRQGKVPVDEFLAYKQEFNNAAK